MTELINVNKENFCKVSKAVHRFNTASEKVLNSRGDEYHNALRRKRYALKRLNEMTNKRISKNTTKVIMQMTINGNSFIL